MIGGSASVAALRPSSFNTWNPSAIFGKVTFLSASIAGLCFFLILTFLCEMAELSALVALSSSSSNRGALLPHVSHSTASVALVLFESGSGSRSSAVSRNVSDFMALVTLLRVSMSLSLLFRAVSAEMADLATSETRFLSCILSFFRAFFGQVILLAAVVAVLDSLIAHISCGININYYYVGFWGFGEIGRASCRERV